MSQQNDPRRRSKYAPQDRPEKPNKRRTPSDRRHRYVRFKFNGEQIECLQYEPNKGLICVDGDPHPHLSFVWSD